MHDRRNNSSTPGRRLAGISAAVLLTVGLASAASGCSESTGSAGGSSVVGSSATQGRLVDTRAFAEVVAQPGVVVLDVRTPEEFALDHLPGAINLDVQDPGFAGALAGLDRDARYAVYCRSGNRSAVAVAAMTAAGFADVVHLAGGITAWVEAQQPVVSG